MDKLKISTISAGHEVYPIRDDSADGCLGSYDYNLGLKIPAWWYSSSPWAGNYLVMLGYSRGHATWQYANVTPSPRSSQRPALSFRNQTS